MASSNLPVNIDTAYSDDAVDPSAKIHQQHHDLIHRVVNWFNKDLAPTEGTVPVYTGSVGGYSPALLDTLISDSLGMTGGRFSLSSVPPGYTHSITLATAKAAANRAAITSRTDIVIRVYGGSSTSEWTSPWLLDGVDYWDLIPSA